MTSASEAPLAEVSLVGSILGLGRWEGATWTQPVKPVGELLLEVDRAIAAGARAVLLEVDSLGGEIGAGYALSAAIREWSDAGVPVVVYVSGWAASIAPLFVCMADAVVAKGQARFFLHAPLPPGGPGLENVDEVFVTLATQGVAVLQCRTLVPFGLASQWLATPLSRHPESEDVAAGTIYATEARRLGLVDVVGGRSAARAAAQAAARAPRGPHPSRRRMQCTDEIWQALVTDVLTLGRQLAAQARARHLQ